MTGVDKTKGMMGVDETSDLELKSIITEELFSDDRFGSFPWIWFMETFNSTKLEDRSQNIFGLESGIPALGIS